MKNRIFLSIVDEKGLKQFNFHKIAKKIVLYGIFGLFALIIGGFFLMGFLMKQVQEIGSVKTEMIQKYRETYLQNQAIKEQIKTKTSELLEVSKKVEDLEEIVDFSKNVDRLEKPEISQLNLEDKLFLLQIIPNGHPLGDFRKITPIKERIHPLKNKYGVDSGIDYWVASNTPVYATADGIIELARKNTSLKGYGRFIKITHAYGFASMYGHLSSVLVKKGDFVKKGQLIGYSGRSGSSAGERMYYEVRFLGGYQNALAYANWGEGNFESLFAQASNVDWNRLFWAIDDLKQLQHYRLSFQEK